MGRSMHEKVSMKAPLLLTGPAPVEQLPSYHLQSAPIHGNTPYREFHSRPTTSHPTPCDPWAYAATFLQKAEMVPSDCPHETVGFPGTCTLENLPVALSIQYRNSAWQTNSISLDMDALREPIWHP